MNDGRRRQRWADAELFVLVFFPSANLEQFLSYDACCSTISTARNRSSLRRLQDTSSNFADTTHISTLPLCSNCCWTTQIEYLYCKYECCTSFGNVRANVTFFDVWFIISATASGEEYALESVAHAVQIPVLTTNAHGGETKPRTETIITIQCYDAFVRWHAEQNENTRAMCENMEIKMNIFKWNIYFWRGVCGGCSASIVAKRLCVRTADIAFARARSVFAILCYCANSGMRLLPTVWLRALNVNTHDHFY